MTQTVTAPLPALPQNSNQPLSLTKLTFMKTKKLLFMAGFLTVCLTSQAQVFEQGTNLLNLGVGIASPYIASGYSSSVPPLSLSFEHGLNEKWGVGGLLGYTSASESADIPVGFGSTISATAKASYFIIGARGLYHFKTTDKLDLYGGGMLAYSSVSASVSISDPAYQQYAGDYSSPASSGVVFGAFVGGRYLFSERIGAFAELGYNIAWLNVGVTTKF